MALQTSADRASFHRERGVALSKSIENLRARFAAAHGSLPALEALKADLVGLRGEAFVDLLCDVMAEIQALRSRRPPPSAAPTDLVGLIMSRAREPGQPLFRYAVTDDEFAALRERLEYLHRVVALEQPNDLSAATFTLYVSEWFRREYDGAGYSWESPHPDIIRSLSDAARKALARQGLAWWGRRPRRTLHGEMRLLSLALEGGFPTRLLESREHGRIAHHLRDLLTRVEGAGQVDEDRAEQMSSMRGSELGSYDHEEFHALCAELVLAIVRLKAESAANAPAGIAASDWLDGVRPAWRDELPIRLAGEGAKRLLDDLVSARASSASAEGMRVLTDCCCGGMAPGRAACGSGWMAS